MSGIIITVYFVSALYNVFSQSLSLLVRRSSQFLLGVTGSVSRESSPAPNSVAPQKARAEEKR